MELLVVIGIIALLISILLPSSNRARDAAKTSMCLSNLRQISLGFSMYTIDNKGYLPPGIVNYATSSKKESWPSLLIFGKYLKVTALPSNTNPSYTAGDPAGDNRTVLRCPNDLGVIYTSAGLVPKSHTDQDGAKVYRRSSLLLQYGALDTSYGIYVGSAGTGPNESKAQVALRNYYFDASNVFTSKIGGCKISQIAQSSNFALVFDGAVYLQDGVTTAGSAVNARHGGRKQANIMFADGHCESVATSGISEAEFTLANLKEFPVPPNPKWRLDQQ